MRGDNGVAWLALILGSPVDIAEMIATAVLVAIMAATKGAICAMAAEDIKAAIKLESIERGRIYRPIKLVAKGFKAKRPAKDLLKD